MGKLVKAAERVLAKLHMKRNPNVTPLEYPRNVLKGQTAKSAVTGGHPEEMNEMPANTDPTDAAPVIDGSELASPRIKGAFH